MSQLGQATSLIEYGEASDLLQISRWQCRAR
jgi:hypothetical protein